MIHDLFKIIEELSLALQCRLALTLDLDLETDISLADAAQVFDLVELGIESDATAGDDGHAKAHLVHTIVDHHLQMVHLDDLSPQMGQQREGQIAMRNRALIGALTLGTLHIDVDPLMVECSVGELVDAVLIHLQPV